MERSTATAATDAPVHIVDATDLAELSTRPGPFASVELATDGAREDAAHAIQLGWEALARRLTEQGAPERVVEALGRHVPDAHQHGRSLSMVASGEGEVLVAEHHPRLPDREVAQWGPLPSVTAIIAQRQWAPVAVVAVADRIGADLYVVGEEVAGAGSAGGRDKPVTRPRRGGWSHRRIQQRGENTWAANAAEVAGQLEDLVARHRPRLVVCAGEVRAVQMLRDHLPDELERRLVEIEGGRGKDGSLDDLQAAVEPLFERAVDEDDRALLAAVAESPGRDLVVTGAPDTLAALAQARVDVLLVGDDPDDDRMAFAGPEPVQVAGDEAALRDQGVGEPVQARLVDVAVRAALGTGAGVRVLRTGADLDGGIGALLRWAG